VTASPPPVTAAARARLAAGVLGGLLGGEVRRGLGLNSPDAVSRAAEIRQALERLGPFFIKVGQMLSTRPDIASPAVIAELEKLHDQVSPAPFERFERVLAAELGPAWWTRFRAIDTGAPLGAASLAQVYRADLRDGTPVVVKVQRPGVRAVVHADMAMIHRLVRVAMRGAPRLRAVLDVEAMLAVILEAMRPELDFRIEARNMRRAAEAVSSFKHLTVPTVIEATPRVLVQTVAPGSSIRQADRAEFTADERLAIGRDLLAFMYRGYFLDRTFHADPHPGNVFVHPGEKATLIDWGMIGRIDRRTGLSIMLILLSLAQNDGHGLAEAWVEMGHATAWADLPGFAGDMAVLVPRIATASLEDLDFGVTLTAVLERSSRRGIHTNPVISLLGKSFSNIEGSVRYLAPELSLVEVFEHEMRGILTGLAREAASGTQAARTAVELMIGASGANGQLRAALRDMAHRQTTVRSGGERPERAGRRWAAVAAVGAAGYLLGRRTSRP
jgi:ubiquinone biosynthesis protein